MELLARCLLYHQQRARVQNRRMEIIYPSCRLSMLDRMFLKPKHKHLKLVRLPLQAAHQAMARE